MPMLAQLVDDVVVNKFTLEPGEVSIGRHPESDIQINDIAVSGNHALLEIEQNKYLEGMIDVYLSDLGSTNGTFINDIPLEGRKRLNNNDIVRIAWNQFKFVENLADTLEKTAYTLE